MLFTSTGFLAHLAVLDALGDAGELLVDDAAGADVGVAHLAVAHLAVRQPHVHAGGPDGGIGILGKKAVQVGGAGRHDGVALDLIGHPAEAVHDTEQYRFFLRHKMRFSYLN